MQYHGGNVYAAARELRKPVDTLLDFSASINPLGPSPKAIRAILHGLLPLRHYPDPDCWTLRQALAKRWHLEPERFAIGNGSSELIHLLPSALAIHHALIIGPTFSEYANAVTVSGGRITTLTASRSNGYKPPLDQVIQIVRASYSSENGRRPIDAIFLCNPNSPTGQACEVSDVVRLATSARRYRVWVIVDETFIEYCEPHSILPPLREFPRVVVLRSFTKFYALPGLRVGYLAASEEAVRRVKAHQAPWSVNSLAQTAAVAALNDRGHARQSLAYMNQERVRFAARLESLPGSSVFPSHANFLLAELPSPLGASQVTAALRQQGLLIRDCSLIPGLNNRSVRIAVRTNRQNDRLMAAIRLLWKRTRHVPH